MSDLIVIGYDDETKAEEVRVKLMQLQKEHLIMLEDAPIVVKKQDGKVKLKQVNNLTASGAATGGLWGLLFGTIFLAPLVGAAVGAASGAAVGALSDIGVNDDFMRELGETIQPGTSALFLLVFQYTPDKVIEEIKPYGGRILHTSLSVDTEIALRERLETAQQEMETEGTA